MPYLDRLPMSNDEADPLSGWWRPVPWRADVRLAAMITMSVSRHLNWATQRYPRGFRLLGGDHGFLAEPPHHFHQRTLLARFPMEDGEEQVFRKPALGALLLLGMLGRRLIKTKITEADQRFSVIATGADKMGLSAEILLTLSDDTKLDPSASVPVTVNFTGLPEGCIYRVFQLSAGLPHPAVIWENAGSPSRPNASLRAQMREAEGPHSIVAETPVERTFLSVNLALALPSVTLIQICDPAGKPPGQVTGLRAVNVSSNEILLFWKDDKVKSRCLLTYEIEFCKNATTDVCIERNGHRRVLYLAYHVAPVSHKVQGRYRVRAVDVWGRPGRYSKPLFYD